MHEKERSLRFDHTPTQNHDMFKLGARARIESHSRTEKVTRRRLNYLDPSACIASVQPLPSGAHMRCNKDES
jgi:hypothetical protein